MDSDVNMIQMFAKSEYFIFVLFRGWSGSPPIIFFFLEIIKNVRVETIKMINGDIHLNI